MSANDYFKNDEYWANHINKDLEEDLWIEEYKTYLNSKGKCLDLGCGIGQFSKQLIKYGYDVISADISDIALNKVKGFNENIVKLDMRDKLPFQDNEFVQGIFRIRPLLRHYKQLKEKLDHIGWVFCVKYLLESKDSRS